MTHRARRGVGLYSVGFILNRTQIATIAKDSFTPEWLEYHIKFQRPLHHLRAALPPFFVAVHFYPWVIGQTPDPEVAGIPEERRKTWNEQYGQYAGKCTEVRINFPCIEACLCFSRSTSKGSSRLMDCRNSSRQLMRLRLHWFAAAAVLR
ncbi:hypothetical protein C8F01DRAFT_1181668 [Mycena amicta]|nr:hypothetical protein C8F01DRAFT_1181668 [Mycena amicta]